MTAKLGINVPWGILHRTDVGIFGLSKNMAAATKVEQRGQTEVFPTYLQKLLS